MLRSKLWILSAESCFLYNYLLSEMLGGSLFRRLEPLSPLLLWRSLLCDAFTVLASRGGSETTITLAVLPIVNDCNCN